MWTKWKKLNKKILWSSLSENSLKNIKKNKNSVIYSTLSLHKPKQFFFFIFVKKHYSEWYIWWFTFTISHFWLLLLIFSSGLVPLWPEYQTGHAGHKSSIQPEREDVTPENRNFNFLTQVESTSSTIIWTNITTSKY